jgi:hypothetical protein
MSERGFLKCGVKIQPEASGKLGEPMRLVFRQRGSSRCFTLPIPDVGGSFGDRQWLALSDHGYGNSS